MSQSHYLHPAPRSIVRDLLDAMLPGTLAQSLDVLFAFGHELRRREQRSRLGLNLCAKQVDLWLMQADSPALKFQPELETVWPVSFQLRVEIRRQPESLRKQPDRLFAVVTTPVFASRARL